MRKIRVFSKSASGESTTVETAIVDAIDKWQLENPDCRIVNHNTVFQNIGNPRLFITLEYDQPDKAN